MEAAYQAAVLLLLLLLPQVRPSLQQLLPLLPPVLLLQCLPLLVEA